MSERYQLRLRGAAQELLAQMCAELRATPKDVILDALAVFRYAINAVKDGQQFGSFDPNKEKFTAIVTPSLQHLSDRRAHNYTRATAG